MLVGLHHNFVILRSWILKVFNKNTISALLCLLRLLSALHSPEVPLCLRLPGVCLFCLLDGPEDAALMESGLLVFGFFAAWVAGMFRQQRLGLKSPNLELTERPDDVTAQH